MMFWLSKQQREREQAAEELRELTDSAADTRAALLHVVNAVATLHNRVLELETRVARQAVDQQAVEVMLDSELGDGWWKVEPSGE